MCTVTLVSVVTASQGLGKFCYSRYSGCRGNSGNRVKVGFSVHGSSDYTGCSGNRQVKISLCAYNDNTDCSGNW